MKIAQSTASSEVAPSEVPSAFDEEGKSLAGSSFVHASQVNIEGQEGARPDLGAGKTKVQLWNDLKISCKWRNCQKTGLPADNVLQQLSQEH